MVLAGLLSLMIAGPTINVRSLLPELTDLRALAHRPSPAFKEAQASSYDRAAFTGDPFANGDAGQFLRLEDKGQRKEHVLADLTGPGTVVRFWSANRAGVVRFYFDGEASPRLSCKLADLLTGRYAPIVPPFAYMASQGANMYFPLPYAKSLKVTVDDTDNDAAKGLYYHVNYRTYPAGTRVETFTVGDLQQNAGEMQRASQALTADLVTEDKPAVPVTAVKPGEVLRYSAHKSISSAVTLLKIKVPFPLVDSYAPLAWDDPFQPHNVLRSLILRMKFDKEETVCTPLGDFFGTVPGLNPYRTLPFEVQADGTMICRLVMPFKFDLNISIENTGKVKVPVEVTVKTSPYDWNDSTYTLHAQWQAERGSTRPIRDMHFMDLKGEGRFMGSVLHVTNPSPAWWGEGDEKFYIDGEERPSSFGTGTEDYYGYAWCSPLPFMKPYHAQTHVDGPSNFGHTSVQRWHIFDSVPYTKSFRFDLEMWHWADVVATYARTTYWYAKPGTTLPAALDKALLLPEKVEMPRVKGAIEGEALTATASGGKVQVQLGFAEPSGASQLWWTEPKVGDTLTLKVPVPEDGLYTLSGNFCHAVDYGIHKLSVNGKELGIFDFFGDGVKWSISELGEVQLAKGEATLVIECVGQNAKAVPSHMFGLDYLMLKPKS